MDEHTLPTGARSAGRIPAAEPVRAPADGADPSSLRDEPNGPIGEAARTAWRSARGFDELCELAAAFLAGRCAHFPGWGAPDPDLETDSIRAPLLALCARGFLPVASQPAFAGVREGRACQQRAFVAGFARDELARRFAGSRGMAVRAWFADGTCASSAHSGATTGPEPMTLEDGVARVVLGHPARDEELALFSDDVGSDALRDLCASAYVAAWDPEFARADDLWDELIHLAAP